ncbi:MAG: hypothetical protein V4764_02765 [Burkholderia sp.]
MDPTQGTGDAADTAEHLLDEQDGSNSSANQQHRPERQQPPRWATQRMGQLSRQRQEAEAQAKRFQQENEELRQQLAAAQQGAGEGGGGSEGDGGVSRRAAAPTGDAANQRAVEEMAEQIAAKRAAEDKRLQAVLTIEKAGREKYPDFDRVIDQTNLLGGFPPAVFQAVSRLEDAHEVFYAIGSDLDLAATLFEMDPVSMGIELARMSKGVRPATEHASLSRAPEPISPPAGRSGGGGSGADLDDEMSDEDWHAARERQRRAARG